jgi:hypothetical protein
VRTGEEGLGTEGEHITGLMSGSDVSNPCPAQVMPAQAHVEKMRANVQCLITFRWQIAFLEWASFSF